MLTLQEAIQLYLTRSYDLKKLRDWLAQFQWELDAEEQLLADEVDEALVYLDDGYVDENEFNLWLSILLEKRTTRIVRGEFLSTPPLPAEVSLYSTVVKTSTAASCELC